MLNVKKKNFKHVCPQKIQNETRKGKQKHIFPSVTVGVYLKPNLNFKEETIKQTCGRFFAVRDLVSFDYRKLFCSLSLSNINVYIWYLDRHLIFCFCSIDLHRRALKSGMLFLNTPLTFAYKVLHLGEQSSNSPDELKKLQQYELHCLWKRPAFPAHPSGFPPSASRPVWSM